MEIDLEQMLYPVYLEKVSSAILIVPDLIARNVHYFVEVGEGKFEGYIPKQTLCSYDIRGETNKINNLIGKKVMFVPIKTKHEMDVYQTLKSKTKQVPLKFYVFELEGENFGKVISMIKAEIYDPFTEMDANRVSKFVSKYIPQVRCTR
ncbi:MAG: hypothetical protein PHC66_04165 [Candidatus Nanoarchaeia archaeon]|nr:hypothetical protein [Candidatus Nanoarchaeia archaeon]MDD5238881.1 hypothetical protein [Candidatus Nanoarchaeia archaeon]